MNYLKSPISLERVVQCNLDLMDVLVYLADSKRRSVDCMVLQM